MLGRAQHVRDVGAGAQPEWLASHIVLVVAEVLAVLTAEVVGLLGGKEVGHVKVDGLLPGVGLEDVPDLLGGGAAGEVVVNLQGLRLVSG